ncbi:unnamed protein product [Caretta caretta]
MTSRPAPGTGSRAHPQETGVTVVGIPNGAGNVALKVSPSTPAHRLSQPSKLAIPPGLLLITCNSSIIHRSYCFPEHCMPALLQCYILEVDWHFNQDFDPSPTNIQEYFGVGHNGRGQPSCGDIFMYTTYISLHFEAKEISMCMEGNGRHSVTRLETFMANCELYHLSIQVSYTNRVGETGGLVNIIANETQKVEVVKGVVEAEEATVNKAAQEAKAIKGVLFSICCITIARLTYWKIVLNVRLSHQTHKGCHSKQHF